MAVNVIQHFHRRSEEAERTACSRGPTRSLTSTIPDRPTGSTGAPHRALAAAGAESLFLNGQTEAIDPRDEDARFIDVAGPLALVSGWTGIDLSELDAHGGLAHLKTNAARSRIENRTVPGQRPFTRADFAACGPRGAPFVVGSASGVSDVRLSWAAGDECPRPRPRRQWKEQEHNMTTVVFSPYSIYNLCIDE